MSPALEAVLYELMSTLPYRILAYYPLLEHMRFSNKATCGLVLTSQLIQMILVYGITLAGYPPQLHRLPSVIVCLATYLLCSRADFSQTLFLYIFVADYLAICRGAAHFVMVSFSPEYPNLYSMEAVIPHMVIFLATLPFMLRLFLQAQEQIFSIQAPKLWRIIWLIPAVTSMMSLIYTWELDPQLIRKPAFLLTRICGLTTMVLVYHVLISALSSIRRQVTAEEEAKQRKHIIMVQRNQYNLLQKQIEETRTARHDLRQHLNLISSYLESGDNEALKEYITLYGKKLPLESKKVYSNNYAVNTIVSYYAQQAEEANISFTARIELPRVLSIEEPDLCVLLGNLLENALEACRASGLPKPFIRLHAELAGADAIVLTTDNTCTVEPVLEENRYLSRKHDGFGTGTFSIRSIARQYNGVVDFQYRDNIFYASVLLHFPLSSQEALPPDSKIR